jgi:hypothetical protein
MSYMKHRRVNCNNISENFAEKEWKNTLKKTHDFAVYEGDKVKQQIENMMSILDTCRKQGIRFFGYLKDIFSAEYAMPRLSLLISQKASSQ